MVVPASLWVLPPGAAQALLAGAVVVALTVEAVRRYLPWARYHFLRNTRVMLRPGERNGLAGATWMAIAYLVALLVFPRVVAATAMLYNALGDAAAAVVGRGWGRRRTGWGKSWEGFLAGLAVCLAVGIAMPGVTVVAAVAGALAAAWLEFLPLPLDDNLRVTLGGGAALWVAMGVG